MKRKQEHKCVICGVATVTKEGGKCWNCVIRILSDDDLAPTREKED